MKHLSWNCDADDTFGGVPIQQAWTALYMLEKFICETRPNIIIELGTGYGALTSFFRMHARTLTYDIKGIPSRNVFDIDVFEEIKANTEGARMHALFFCDDGNKSAELWKYWPLVKRSDHILVHDWKRPGGIWPKDLVGLKGRVKYRQDEFDSLKTCILSLVRKA